MSSPIPGMRLQPRPRFCCRTNRPMVSPGWKRYRPFAPWRSHSPSANRQSPTPPSTSF